MAKVRTRKRGKRYYYSFEAGVNPKTGKRKIVEKGSFATKKEAFDAGTIAYADWKRGDNSITSEKVTLETFTKNWLENVASLNVRSTTLSLYTTIANHQIYPQLGKMHIQDITPAVLDKWIRSLTREGYARHTLHTSYSVLNQVLKYAVYPCEILQSNPAGYIKVPRSAPQGIVKRRIIQPDEFARMLSEHPVGDSFRIVLLLLYHTGMRVSEVCGLSWQDIDFGKGTVTVRRQLHRVAKRGLVVGDTKNRSSRRTIYIDNELLSALKKWRAIQAENELQHGDSYIYAFCLDDMTIRRASKVFAGRIVNGKRIELVCTQESGAPFEQHTISTRLQKYQCNPHSFRHTHATLLAEAGVSAKDISSRLGHSSTSVTESVYMHETEKMARYAADIFGKIASPKP